LATGQAYLNVFVQLVENAARHDRSTGTGAASHRFPYATLMHAEVNLAAIPDSHEADICVARKSFVGLDEWAESLNVGIVDPVHLQYTMRITHRKDRHAQGISAGLQRVHSCPFIGNERNFGRFEFRLSHAHGHRVLTENAHRDRTGRAAKRKVAFLPGVAGDHPGNATNAVAALLDFTTVRVEHTVIRKAVGVAGRANPHELIEADTRAAVSEAPDIFGRRYFLLSLALIDDQKIIAGAVHFPK
jgi:hypothetical protein